MDANENNLKPLPVHLKVGRGLIVVVVVVVVVFFRYNKGGTTLSIICKLLSVRFRSIYSYLYL